MSSSLTDSLRETLALFEGEDAGTPRTTSEVAEALDLGRRSTYERLQRLVEHDRIETKKVGARGRVWWRPRPTDEGADDGDGADDAVVSRLIDNVPGMVYRCRNEPGWPMSFVSDAAGDLTGYDPVDIESGAVQWGEDVVHPDDRVSFREDVERQLADGDRFTVEYRIVTPDDGTRWVREHGVAVDDGDEPNAVLEGVVTDVTDEVRSKRALADREQQFRSLVEATEEYAIFRLDADGCVQTWNAGAERIKGYDRDQIVGEHFSTFYTEEDRAAGVPGENLAAAAADGVTTDEGWRVREDGSRFWANVTISAVNDPDGKLRGFAKVTRDMTDRRQREQAVRHERNLLAQVLDVSPIAIGVFDDQGDPLRVNEQFTTMLGIPGDDPEGYVLGEQPLLDEHGDELPHDERPAPQVLSTGEPVHDRRVRVDGPERRTRWLSVNAEPLDDAEGVVATMADVTRLKEQADRLERQRDDLASEIEAVFERVDDGFFALDRDLVFTYVNDRAGDLLDHPAGELVGEHIWDAFEPGAKAEAAFEEALSTQKSVTFEEYYEPLDTWFENHLYPSETGMSVYFQDVTERKRRERDLERYERMIETVDDGIYLLDDEDRFRLVNDAFVAMTGYDRDELLGTHAELVFGEKYVRIAAEKQDELEADEIAVAVVEEDLYPAAADPLIVESRFTMFEFEDGETGRVGTVRDVTERVERERELERYETIVETMDDGVYVIDVDGRFSMVNDAYAAMLGYDPEELLGMTAADVVDEVTAAEAREAHRRLATGASDTARLEAELRTADGEHLVAEATFALIDGEGSADRVAVVRDVTERKERERELEQYERIVETVDDGIYAIDTDARFVLVNDALCEMAGYDREELLGMDATALYDDEVGDRVAEIAAHVSAGERDVGRVEFDLLREGGSRVPVETRFGPIPYGDDDGRCGVVRDISDRLERERELERQREQLAALNNLHGVVRRINEAVIEQSTRTEVEQVVVEALADSDSYRFAWVADADRHTGDISLRAEAGVENYLDGLPLTLSDDGPTPRAFRTGEVHAVNDVRTDDSYRQWRDWAADHAYQSAAAIPIVHDGTVYGVLNVYADRRGAFAAAEREVVGQLGEIVGHAIASVERKQALMSDEVVELEFRIPDFFEAFDLPVGSPDGVVTLEQTVALGDGDYLEYGTATGDAIGIVESLVESPDVPPWTALNVLGEGDDGTRFELTLTEPPVISKLASHGGYVHEATIVDGVYSMRVHLAPSSDVRTVIDAIEEAYPSIQMMTRRQVSRDRASREQLARTVLGDLTDRQRTSLEAAYYSGFFEWPRDSSGEDIAESLGISAPTFHQHLRKAQQQVVGAALNG